MPTTPCYAFNFKYYHMYFKAVYASTKSLRMRKMAQNNYDVPVTFLCKLSHNVNYKNSREGRQHVQKLYTEYHTKQGVPFSITFEKKALKDFIGRDSWTLFQLLDVDFGFLEHSATKWETLESYQKGKHVVSDFPKVNNAVERAQVLAADSNTKMNSKICIKLFAEPVKN